MSEESWGPWIDGSVPPPVGAYVQMDCVDLKGRGDMTHECVVLRIEGETVIISPTLPVYRCWQVDQYRIRRPKGLTILEGLLENLPEDVDARNTLTAG